MKKVLHRILRASLLLIIRVLGASNAYRSGRRARTRLASPNPRILLIHPGPLGSLVMTTPVFHALKARLPDAHITVMVGPWAQEVVAGHPDVDRLLTCPFPSFRAISAKGLKSYVLLIKTARQLSRERYDLAISLHRTTWWSASLLYLAGIPRRIGYITKSEIPFLTHPVPLPEDEHLTVARLRIVSIGLQVSGYSPLEEPYTPERYPLRFVPTAQEREWVSQLLSREGISPASPIVVIHPGTSVPVKLWRSEAWSRCATVLCRASSPASPLQIVLTGTPREQPLLQEIAQNIPTPVLMVTNATVGQLAALLDRSELVLGVDSGPLHLATALGTPTVRLYGPTKTSNYGPWGSSDRHRMIISTHCCASCPAIPCGRLYFKPRELESHPCVRLIPEREVLMEIARLLPFLLQPEMVKKA